MAAISARAASVSHGFERLGPDRISARPRAMPTRCSKPRSRPAPTTSNPTTSGHEIWTAVDSLHEVAKALEADARRGGSGQARLEAVDRGRGSRRRRRRHLMKLIDALEEDDDVQTVWGNYNVPEEELEKLA